MGSRTVSFSFTPGENEQLETIIKIPEEKRSIIHGVVKSHCNKVIKNAIVKLYECISQQGHRSLKPLTHTFTDESGQFAFGPLVPCRNYVIKVWVNDVKIRELVIHPDDCECRNQKPNHQKPMFSCEVNQDSEEVEELEDDFQEIEDESNTVSVSEVNAQLAYKKNSNTDVIYDTEVLDE